MDKTIQIDTFTRFTQVSRETITSLKKYEDILINANKTLNLIGKSTINDIWTRHFLDSVQVIDFIDKNDKTLIDLGSGAGFPGIVVALVAKDRKIAIKIKLIEKSPKKAKFLKDLIDKLNLNVEVHNQNVLEEQIEISAHYSGYLEKQEADIVAFRKDESLLIPRNIDYSKLSGLSNEVKSKFNLIRPKTLGQALRIDGITPAAAYILLSHVKKGPKKHKIA